MLAVKEEQECGLAESEFNSFLSKIVDDLTKLREQFKKILIEYAPMLGKMSRPQVYKLKNALDGIISGDGVDRMVLFGRGKIGIHLALPDRRLLPAGTLKVLPSKTLKVLNDPEASVPVLTVGGVKIKKVGDCTSWDFSVCLDKKNGLLIPEQQRNRIPLSSLPKKSDEDLDEVLNIVALDEHNVVLETKDGVRAKVSLKMLRQFIK